MAKRIQRIRNPDPKTEWDADWGKFLDEHNLDPRDIRRDGEGFVCIPREEGDPDLELSRARHEATPNARPAKPLAEVAKLRSGEDLDLAEVSRVLRYLASRRRLI